VIWLLTILFKGKSCKVYQVGSGRIISIRELADKISKYGGKKAVFKNESKGIFDTYIPRIKGIEEVGQGLELKQTIGLNESLRRTIEWHRSRDV
jgi:dTDP-glucose 4,6-dehydratase